jgi:hypothetical protein
MMIPTALLFDLDGAKWFCALIDLHKPESSDLYFKLFEPFVIGGDLNSEEGIVYLNTMSSFPFSR